MTPDTDPGRFPVQTVSPRGFAQAYVRAGDGGVPLLLVHGWPETKRIWWKVIAPLAAAGFDVVVPDLRGFGDSEVGPDGFHDVPAHAQDLAALLTELGLADVVLAGGDLGGPVIQDLSLRHPELVDRMVLFNSPLPFDKEAYAGLNTRSPWENRDYFERQGTDPDGLAADLSTPDQRRRYIATFYTSRHWSAPGNFTPEEVAFQTEPWADGAKLRASFGAYESVYDPAARSGRSAMAMPNRTPTMLLFGPQDHVIMPDFDRMAEAVFPDRVGPFLLRDCGHFVMWEAAERFVGATVTFCKDRLR